MDFCLWACVVWTLTAMGNFLTGDDPYLPALLAWIFWCTSDVGPIWDNTEWIE